MNQDSDLRQKVYRNENVGVQRLLETEVIIRRSLLETLDDPFAPSVFFTLFISLFCISLALRIYYNKTTFARQFRLKGGIIGR